MFMLNMLFDLNDKNGLFTDTPKSTDLLQRSYAWLKYDATDPYGTTDFDRQVFDPERSASQRYFSSKGTLFIPSRSDKHRMLLRIAPAPNVQIPADATAEIVVAFGRAVRAQQKFASPFTDRQSDQTKTSFCQTGQRAEGLTGWILDMGPIATVPDDEDSNLAHRYEFSIGAKITAGTQVRWYGEDPEFDIGL
jgi:hypothetical protein